MNFAGYPYLPQNLVKFRKAKLSSAKDFQVTKQKIWHKKFNEKISQIDILFKLHKTNLLQFDS